VIGYLLLVGASNVAATHRIILEAEVNDYLRTQRNTPEMAEVSGVFALSAVVV
jgi:hypothetical protein